jgi:hypothetical protein
MAELVYVIGAVASIVCLVLLWRGWRRSGARLLLWTAACFLGFVVNNVVLLLDETIWRDVADLRWLRHGSALAGCMVLLGGLIWDSGRQR